MSATIIDGTAIAAAERRRIAEGVLDFKQRHGRVPGLSTVLVGEDPASVTYVAGKVRACTEVGMVSAHRPLPADFSQDDLLHVIHALADDDTIDGILVQLPLPGHIDEPTIIEAIPVDKDVDGFHPWNIGRVAQGADNAIASCTPAGVMTLLREAGVELAGATATVVGRSLIVGRPMASLLLSARATVTCAHRHTRDLAAATRGADVLVVAAGVPGLITADMVKPGAVVIDVGITRTEDGLVGDVDFIGVSEVASAITPVPGGVGPMTVATLLDNTLRAASQRMGDAASWA